MSSNNIISSNTNSNITTLTQKNDTVHGLGGAEIIPFGTPTDINPLGKEQQNEPLDLLRHLPEGDFKQYVSDVAKMCNIHPSTSLLIGLGIFSSIACRKYAVQYLNGEPLPLGEYVICGGLPGDSKSRMLKAYQYPVFNAQKEAYKAFKQREENHSVEQEKKVEAALRRKQEGGKVEKHEETILPFDEEPPLRKIFDTDATGEALEPILSESNGYFALASAEQAIINTLTGATYAAKGQKTNNDLALKGFNGEYHASSRTTRKGYVGMAVGAITCFAQPQVIETILNQSGGTGLADRFLMLEEPTQQGTRDHTQWHQPDENSKQAYERIAGDLASDILKNGAAEWENLTAWRINKEDWQKIGEFRNEIEPKLKDGGEYSHATLRGTASKVDMHIMKVATLLALLHDHKYGEIPSKFIEAGIGIMRDMLKNRVDLLTRIGAIGFDAEEQVIIEFIGDKRGATLRQIKQAKRKVRPFIESQNPSEAVGVAVERLKQKGVIAESYDANGSPLLKLMA
ncbi:MAG: hypothetical protein CSA79_00550 [Thiothrix nivea]|nr:MAG: hypothetical protein CSA79_00550 [Thiothrix nivea]